MIILKNWNPEGLRGRIVHVMTKRILRSRVLLVLALLGDVMLYSGSGPYDYSGVSFENALALQAQVTDDWLAREGVVGTAIGVDGTGHAVLKVYLTELGIAAFPRFVVGVEVVTEVTGAFVALPAGADNEAVDPTGSFPRPVPIGVSTGHGDVTAGTIGARATDGERTFALSNNHIFAANNGGNPGDNLLQPGVVDGGKDPDDVFGTLYDYEPIEFCRGLGCKSNKIDAAIALTTPEQLGSSTPEGGYGSPRGWTEEAKIGMNVQKYGRTTGHTVGRVTGLNARV